MLISKEEAREGRYIKQGLNMPNTITSTALNGIYDAYKRINERTERISQFAFTEDDTSLVSDLVGLKTDIYTVKANSKVIASDKELTNSILDILA